MKKQNSKGFVLAETLVVTVFLMIIFTMIYSNFFPLIGEYEKRENYDNVDSKYAVYWLKRLIEDSSYDPTHTVEKPTVLDQTKTRNLEKYGFMRFECKNVLATDEKNNLCKKMVNALEVSGCDPDGNNCDIFITHYRIGGVTPDFKVIAKNKLEKFKEDCSANGTSDSTCQTHYIQKCVDSIKDSSMTDTAKTEKCRDKMKKSVFDSSFNDYIAYLPDYSAASLNNAKYRVIARFQHRKDNNNYYTYSTIEVNR